MAKEKLETASVLAFERKLDPSDGVFRSGNWNDQDNSNQWPAVVVRGKSVRGTISNRQKTKDQDPAKLDASIQNPNLQTVDVAMLPSEHDTLCVQFTLRVLGGAGVPSACNNMDYQGKLNTTVAQYVDRFGFKTLAERYAQNLANGRFLWRNRMGAEAISIKVKCKQGEEEKHWQFDALAVPLREFNSEVEGLAALAEVIESGLSGQSHVLLSVSAYVNVGAGQEVYPSQELVLEKSDKSKTLYTLEEDAAGMHSQKIGNALRTIDTWYPGAGDLGPIAVEPYGSVTSQGKAYRVPKEKSDFYTLLDNWVLKDEAPANDGDMHFVMATLIRGGVFGASGKD